MSQFVKLTYAANAAATLIIRKSEIIELRWNTEHSYTLVSGCYVCIEVKETPEEIMALLEPKPHEDMWRGTPMSKLNNDQWQEMLSCIGPIMHRQPALESSQPLGVVVEPNSTEQSVRISTYRPLDSD